MFAVAIDGPAGAAPASERNPENKAEERKLICLR